VPEDPCGSRPLTGRPLRPPFGGAEPVAFTDTGLEPKHAERSRLKDKSLRLPGQSPSEQLQKLLDDRIETPGLWAALCIVLAGLEWWRWYKPIPPQPILYSVVALLAALYAGWRVWRARAAIRRSPKGSMCHAIARIRVTGP
jgi:hypothetical protein